MSGNPEELARAAIETRFNTLWAAHTPIAFDNSAFTPPAAAPWVRLSIAFGDTRQIGFGVTDSQLMRTVGAIMVNCFTPLNSGSTAGLTLVARVRDIFQNKTFSGVLCRATGLLFTAPDQQLPFYGTLCQTPFQTDTLFP